MDWILLAPMLLSLACWPLSVDAASTTGKPSILLMFPDELRYDWGGTHNNPYYTKEELPLRMPNIDALARRGVRFTRAVVPSPVCAPSRACLASGREYDPAGQGGNGASTAPTHDGDFDVEQISTFYQELQRQGYYTMVTGRDDLTKRTGPGLDGKFHSSALGFNDSARCGGSVDVTWGECGGADNGAAPCAGIFSRESETRATVHEPYGAWLEKQHISDDAVREKYSKIATQTTGNETSVTNYFELDFWRYAELTSRGAYDTVHWYAIPDTLPFEQRVYQDDWISDQALALLRRAPTHTPWFLEISHQAPHPPMDITAAMQATMSGRETGWPRAYSCAAHKLSPVCAGAVAATKCGKDGQRPAQCQLCVKNAISALKAVGCTNLSDISIQYFCQGDSLCEPATVQRLRHNYAAKIERLDTLFGGYLQVIDERGETATTVTCLASDHGEMLADRATTAKSKPWNSAMSVPLICAGPGIARDKVVSSPVTTLDLAATFIVLAGGTVHSEMNSTSLLPLLKEPTAPPPRTVVHSGLSNFRVVIKIFNQSMALKLICCKGSCPGSTTADRSEQLARKAPDEIHLFNIAAANWETAGRWESPELDLAASSGLLTDMGTLLPAGDHRPSFSWPGCDFSGWPGGPPPPPPPAPVPPHTNLTGMWNMLHGGTTEITQRADGSLTMPVFKPNGVGHVTGKIGWFEFGSKGHGENLTLTVDAEFNTIKWSNQGVWHRVD